jgi:hypothetical protein
MKSKSPLLFTSRAGLKTRIIFGTAFLVLSGFILYFTVVGLQTGRMYLGGKYGNGHYFYRDRNPNGFWFATAVDFGMGALFAVLSVRDLMFTARHAREIKERA